MKRLFELIGHRHCRDVYTILAVTMTDAQFTTMERESSQQGQFWELDET